VRTLTASSPHLRDGNATSPPVSSEQCRNPVREAHERRIAEWPVTNDASDPNVSLTSDVPTHQQARHGGPLLGARVTAGFSVRSVGGCSSGREWDLR